jgi:hypothetical protein
MIGDILKKNGYTLACKEKWHMGLNWEQKDTALSLIPALQKSGYINSNFISFVTGGLNDLVADYSIIFRTVCQSKMLNGNALNILVLEVSSILKTPPS